MPDDDDVAVDVQTALDDFVAGSVYGGSPPAETPAVPISEVDPEGLKKCEDAAVVVVRLFLDRHDPVIDEAYLHAVLPHGLAAIRLARAISKIRRELAQAYNRNRRLDEDRRLSEQKGLKVEKQYHELYKANFACFERVKELEAQLAKVQEVDPKAYSLACVERDIARMHSRGLHEHLRAIDPTVPMSPFAVIVAQLSAELTKGVLAAVVRSVASSVLHEGDAARGRLEALALTDDSVTPIATSHSVERKRKPNRKVKMQKELSGDSCDTCEAAARLGLKVATLRNRCILLGKADPKGTVEPVPFVAAKRVAGHWRYFFMPGFGGSRP